MMLQWEAFVVAKWHFIKTKGCFLSPVPSGIMMTHSELDCVQVGGTVGHVSVMIKCCSAAALTSHTT